MDTEKTKWRPCQCEHVSHTSKHEDVEGGCNNEAMITLVTEYGEFEVCSHCKQRGHMQ